jgi:Domain of unknown function (DUF4277)
VEKQLGALPVVADYCRLDLAGTIDRACPIRDVAILSHGQVIQSLVANRLTSPSPMVHVGDWARAWAVDEAFDISASALNDDPIARAPEAIAAELDRIVGPVGAQAIAAFGVDVSGLHCTKLAIMSFDHPLDPRFRFAIAVATAMANRYVRSPPTRRAVSGVHGCGENHGHPKLQITAGASRRPPGRLAQAAPRSAAPACMVTST